mgnify:CR=1 FL=1
MASLNSTFTFSLYFLLFNRFNLSIKLPQNAPLLLINYANESVKTIQDLISRGANVNAIDNVG